MEFIIGALILFAGITIGGTVTGDSYVEIPEPTPDEIEKEKRNSRYRALMLGAPVLEFIVLINRLIKWIQRLIKWIQRESAQSV